MVFKQALEAILERTEGSLGALIMGIDGISVEKLMAPDGVEANLDVAAAEFTSLVRNAQRTGADTGHGNLRELVVSLEDATIIMRLFNREYYIVLALKADGNLGRGRYELRKAELQLAQEFAV